MTDYLENLILSEAHRLGFQPNAAAMRQVSFDLADSSLTEQGLINMPSKGEVHPADFVRGLRTRMPENFGGLADDNQTEDVTRRKHEAA